MRIRHIFQEALKSVAVLVICSYTYLRFLTTPVLDVLSFREWSIIGLVVAILIGVVCRLLIRNSAVLGFLAVAGFIGGAIYAEVYYSVPLSHDTAESSTWSAYIRSALYTWPYELAGTLAIIAGWHFGSRHLWQRRIRQARREYP
jgi:hypothetical protein